ncbi:MAG: peptidyl-prolyl cis-trans isomerase [Aquificaceae bacterium]
MKLFYALVFSGICMADVVVRINKDTITTAELRSKFNTYWNDILHLPLASATRRDIQDFLLEMVRAKIIKQEAKKLGITVSNQEISEYIIKRVSNKDLNPTIKELLEYEIISVKLIDHISKEIKIDEKEIEAYYYVNMREFLTPAQVLVKHYKAPDLESANEIISILSTTGQSEKLRNYQGRAFWYSIQTLPEQIKRQLYPFERRKISKPIKVGDEYLILQVIDTRGSGIIPFSEAKNIVRDKLLIEKRQEVFKKWFQETYSRYSVEFYFGRLQQVDKPL